MLCLIFKKICKMPDFESTYTTIISMVSKRFVNFKICYSKSILAFKFIPKLKIFFILKFICRFNLYHNHGFRLFFC